MFAEFMAFLYFLYVDSGGLFVGFFKSLEL